MIYVRMTGYGGSYVEYYYLKKTGAEFIDKLKKNEERDLQCVIFKPENGYRYLSIYDQKSATYFHTWLHINNSEEKALLIFYGTSEKPGWNNASLINKDFGYLNRHLTMNYFNEVILKKITLN